MSTKQKEKIKTPEVTEVNKVEKVQSPGRMVINRLFKNKLAIIGLGILIFMILFSTIGPLFSPHDPDAINIIMKNKAPSSVHWLGTDVLGRDVLTRLMLAGRISLSVGFIAVSISVTIGGIVGSLAGYYGGLLDTILMRFVDVFLALPTLPLLIILGAILSDLEVSADMRIVFVMIIIGLLSWPGVARLVRGQILSLREQEFMQAAQATGLKDSRKIFKHLLPNTIPAVIVSATIGIGGAILTESALSYLGMGVTPPSASWGNMIQAVNDYIVLKDRPWLWIPPGICILLTVVSINLLGDGLRDALDPKLKR